MPGFTWRTNAKSLTSTSNGANIGLPETVGGGTIAASTGSATYQANAINGKPGIRIVGTSFSGATTYEIPRASNAAFYAAKDSQNWTAYIAFTASVEQDPLSCFLQINDDLDAIRLNRNSDKQAGTGVKRGGVNGLASVPDSNMHVLGIMSTTASVTGQTSTGRTVITLDGLPIDSYPGAIPRPGNKTGGGSCWLGAFSNSFYGTTLTLLDYVVYPTSHAVPEMWDNTKALRFDAGLSMPSKILLVDGSSLKGAVGADAAAYATACEIMRQCGLPFGSVGTMALGGIAFAGMREKAGELDGFLSRVGAANCYLLAGEGYNELVSGTAADAATKFVSYLTDRVTAGWLPGNIFIDTITGVVSGRPGAANYPAYAAAVKAIPGSNPPLAAVRPINTAGAYSDNDAQFGIGLTGQTTDGLHLTGKMDYPATDSGYPRQVSLIYKTPIQALNLAA